ncbi:LOW QUALITY PROTEIN: clusterin-like protein 1 [Salarias fasciatus]|uniref:LOW QUALITY PROTEIN: clusterin-like protein 1 n=1 Tax=Salarias fasciatus TaxID=181472 RepID=UPI001176C89F|nr:LOW QUALITY PROTEIN: clusterin-like protein 1 [Salarias fasciatus]
MRKLVLELFCITEALLCAAEPLLLNEARLRNLSAAGQRYIDEEIKQSLLGVMQVKEKMEGREEKHRHLMDALRLSSEKKKGAAHLAKETEGKLKEAEKHCQDLSRSSFEKCRPCLEDSCRGFYTSTCRRGFASFSSKMEDFFRKMSLQLEAKERVDSQQQEDSSVAPSADKRLTEDGDDLELQQAEASFSQLQSNVSVLYNGSVALIRKTQQVSDRSFLAAFAAEPQISSHSTTQGGLRAFLFRSAGLDRILDSVYDFGKNVLEDFSSTVAEVYEGIQEAEESVQQSTSGLLSAWQYSSGNLCRQLRRQVSECWQLQGFCEACEDRLLKECSGVQQLYAELEQMSMLLNASRQQYGERLQLVRRHTADTRRWLGLVDDEHGWVSQLPGSTAEPTSSFRVITVNPQQQTMGNRSGADTSVVVSIFDSSPLTISVPADLDVDEPAFIHFVAEEALATLKHQMRGMSNCEDPSLPAVSLDDE